MLQSNKFYQIMSTPRSGFVLIFSIIVAISSLHNGLAFSEQNSNVELKQLMQQFLGTMALPNLANDSSSREASSRVMSTVMDLDTER